MKTADILNHRKNRILKVDAEALALDQYPPPADLRPREIELWNSTLDGMPARLFRKRNIPVLRQYISLIIKLDELDIVEDIKKWMRISGTIRQIENHLGISVRTEIARQNAMERASSVKLQMEIARLKREAEEAEKNANGGAPVDARKSLFASRTAA